MKGLLGTKVGMTQIWQGDKVIPVTVVLAGPCPVVQRKMTATDGYDAVQLGFGEQKERRLTRPELGHLHKGGVPPVRYLREFRDFQASGSVVRADIFAAGEYIKVTGTSKGHGTAGVMKRWHFKGGPASHGSKKWHRRPGSIGQRKTPGRVYRGKRMAGRDGGSRVTVRNLLVVDVRLEDDLILIKGGIPGPKGGLLVLSGLHERGA